MTSEPPPEPPPHWALALVFLASFAAFLVAIVFFAAWALHGHYRNKEILGPSPAPMMDYSQPTKKE